MNKCFFAFVLSSVVTNACAMQSGAQRPQGCYFVAGSIKDFPGYCVPMGLSDRRQLEAARQEKVVAQAVAQVAEVYRREDAACALVKMSAGKK